MNCKTNSPFIELKALIVDRISNVDSSAPAGEYANETIKRLAAEGRPIWALHHDIGQPLLQNRDSRICLGDFDILIVPSISFISRNVSECQRFINDGVINGIRVIAVDDEFDSANQAKKED